MASSTLSRARTYLGLHAMQNKLRRLVSEFSFAPLNEVCDAHFNPAATVVALPGHSS